MTGIRPSPAFEFDNTPDPGVIRSPGCQMAGILQGESGSARKSGGHRLGCWLVFRTDWSKRIVDPASFLNRKEDGSHTPGPTKETVEWLIHERKVLGFAVETINTDAGQSYRWPLPYPCHTLMHGSGRFGLQCLRNLDQLPPTGAILIAAPLKIQNGSGSPLRVLALVSS